MDLEAQDLETDLTLIFLPCGGSVSSPARSESQTTSSVQF